MQTSEGLSEQNSEASYNYQKESIKNSVVINPPDATDSELQPSLFEERRHHCEAIAISNTAASDLNHQSNDYHFAKSPVIEDHQLNCLKTSIEIVIKILKLNDTLLQHVQDEEILLRSISDGKKTKLRYKCKLYEVLNYIDLVKGYISDWNTVWEQRDLADTRYYMPLYNRDMITSVKFNLLHHLYTFLIYLEKIIYYGLELLAYQGIHEVSVSQLQKVIVGIVSYNSFLENIDGYLRNIEALRSSTEGDNWEFSKLPDPIGIRKILQIFSGVRANALSKIFVSLIVESVRQNEKEFQNLNDSNIWQECLSLAGHFHPEPHMLSPVSPVSELNIGEDCSGVSDHENLLCEAGPSHVTPGLSNYDSLITEMHTLYTQDDLNIRKLASVIHLSFMDVQNPKCNQQANWLLLNNQEMPFAQFDSSSMHTRMIPNLISAYKLEFEKACLSHIKQLLENQWTLRGIGCSEFSIGSVLLLSPQQLIEMGKCALNVACSLETQVPLTRVYQHFTSYFYLLAALKSWDLSFCNALAAISAHRSVPALLATNTNGTYAGKCLIDCLESIIGLEVMINTKPGFDVCMIQNETYQRFLTTLEAASLWLETKLHNALYLWHLRSFCLITHGDLKRIIDLLKHTVNITPVQRSSSCSCTLSSPLICREASIRHLTQWEEIEKAAVRIQNCSSTCMKDFCKACERKTKTELKKHMPGRKIWRQRCKRKVALGFPIECSPYARIVVDDVLAPIVQGVECLPTPVQISVISMATKVFCESWMTHILNNQLKFSLNGAQLLKLDFNYLLEFLHSQSSLSMETRQSVQALEILRHLKGVAALLLRQNESSRVNIGIRNRKVVPLCDLSEVERQGESPQLESLDGSDSVTSDSVTDEDYVVDKETWLSLRLSQPKSFTKTPFWCFS